MAMAEAVFRSSYKRFFDEMQRSHIPEDRFDIASNIFSAALIIEAIRNEQDDLEFKAPEIQK